MLILCGGGGVVVWWLWLWYMISDHGVASAQGQCSGIPYASVIYPATPDSPPVPPSPSRPTTGTSHEG